MNKLMFIILFNCLLNLSMAMEAEENTPQHSQHSSTHRQIPAEDREKLIDNEVQKILAAESNQLILKNCNEEGKTLFIESTRKFVVEYFLKNGFKD